MIIKYIDPKTNCTVIQEFSSIFMEKVEDDTDYRYEMTFVCDMAVVCAFCNSYSLINEYMNTIFETQRIDFSADANVMIKIEKDVIDEMSDLQDSLWGMLGDSFDDEDSEYDDQFDV